VLFDDIGIGTVNHWYLGSETGTNNQTNAHGWLVSYTPAAGFTVTVPNGTAPEQNVSLSFCTKTTGSTPDTAAAYGPTATVDIVATPAAHPPDAPGPPRAWQGAVSGINTGNGNKITTLPLVGWTMRGGMSVSCALIHNSESSLYGTFGDKWLVSYQSSLTRDSSGAVTVTWDTGQNNIYTVTYPGQTIYTSPLGTTATLSYVGNGNSYDLTTQSKTRYHFGLAVSGVWYLTSISDIDGNTLTIDHAGTLVSSVVDATNRTLTYNYSGGRLASVSDPKGRLWSLTYDGSAGAGNLWYVTLPPVVAGQAAGAGIYFGYDNLHNITAMRSAEGRTSTFAYNPDSGLAWAKDAAGNKVTFAYNPTNTVITDANGHTTIHTYQYGFLKSVTDALNNSENYYYDWANTQISRQDRRGHFWNSGPQYQPKTQIIQSYIVSDALGYSSSSTSNDLGSPLTQKDALGKTTTTNTYSPDGLNHLQSSAVSSSGSQNSFSASSSVSGYTYGLPSTAQDALGKSSSLTYDGNGYVKQITDASSHVSSVIYNALGWKMSSTDGLNQTTYYTYDNWGRVTDIQAPDNTHTQTSYDLDGNVLTVTDADHTGTDPTTSHVITNIYDGDGRLTQTTNGRGDVVKYTYDGPTGYGSYDSNGNTQYGLLSAKIDGNGHKTLYTYTARNEPWITKYPDGTAEAAGYDENGNVNARSKPDGTAITYGYDWDNRLKDITYPRHADGTQLHATHFDYDNDGRRTGMSDATGTTTWTYGDGLHLTQTVTPYGTAAAPGTSSQTVGYGYDLDGRRITMSLAGLGSWTYTYYDNGQPWTVRTPYGETTTSSYDTAGRMNYRTNGDGTIRTMAYDAASQVTDLYDYTGAGQVARFHYDYTPAGQVRRMTQNDTVTTDYGYDGANQLTSEVHAGDGAVNYSLGYSYDNNGNRLTQTKNGQQVQSFIYDGHDKLISGGSGGEQYGYDTNGNQTTLSYYGSQYGFAWDDEDRLTRLTFPDGHVNIFSYNGLGLRVAKTDSTGQFALVSDGTSPASPVIADGAAVYTPGLSERRNGASLFRHDDLLGSLRFLTDSSEGVQAYRLFSGFGATVAASGAAWEPFGWAGAAGDQTDADTGLVLMGHRLYDSRLGRFISQDPAGDGDNWYRYAGNDPVNKTDPTGLATPLYNNLSTGDVADGTGQMGFGSSLWTGGLDGLFANQEAYTTSDIYQQAEEAQSSTIEMSKNTASANEGESANLYLGMVLDFLAGGGASVRNYGANSTQVQTFLISAAASDVFLQLAEQGFSKNAAGSVGHVAAFLHSIGDPVNGSQGHMGAFDWHVQSKVGNTLNVVVHNDMSRASFLGGNSFGFKVSNPSSGAQRTITEYLRFSVSIPRR